MKYLLIALALFCGWTIVSEAREEMGALELLSTTKKICDKKSPELWEVVIRCHDPIDDDFLRASDEANCPRSTSDPDPTDESVPMQRVFETLCNTITLNPIKLYKTAKCLKDGHEEEVAVVQQKYGEDVPENIVKCIRAIDLDQY